MRSRILPLAALAVIFFSLNISTLQAQDLNLITAVLVGVALVLPKIKAKLFRKPIPVKTGGQAS